MPQICLYLTSGAPWRQKKVLQIGQNGPNQTPILKTPRKVVKVFSQSAKFHPHFRIVSVIWSKKTLDLALKYYSGAPWRQKKVLQIRQKGLN